MIDKSNELLTIEELAKILAIKKSHIRSLVFKKKIPYLKVGKLIRFSPDEIKRWIEDIKGRGV